MKRTKGAELVLPARQARSRMTRDRLLEAGRQLLEQGAFEATSIADIARAAGCSVGVFYQRYPNKEAFFAVIVETILAEMVVDARRTAAEMVDGSIDRVLLHCVRQWVQTHRRHQGFMRTLMKKTLHESEHAWTPLREAGRAAIGCFVDVLASRSGQAGNGWFRYRANAAFQIITGAMVNATLHRTAVLNLNGDNLIPWATEILRHCLFDELPPALKRHRVARRNRA